MKYRDLRHLVQLRDICVKERTRWKQRIKSLLLLEGIEFPAERWSKATREKLRELECRATIGYKLEFLIVNMEGAEEEILKASQALCSYLKKDEQIQHNLKYLMSTSSIGWITASHFLARVGDPSQLQSVKKTCRAFA